MQTAAVTDRDSLEAYLKGLPEDEALLTARRVAHRAAARIAPLGLLFFAKRLRTKSRELTVLPMFVALSYSGVAAVYPTPEYDRAANAAYAAANAAADAAYAADAYAAANAAANAAYAADAAANAADAAYAADAAANAADGWEWVRCDLIWCATNAPEAVLPPLWQGLTEPPKLTQAWVDAQELLAQDDKVDWRVFTLLINRLREGRDIHAEKLAEALDTLTRKEIEGEPGDVLRSFDDLRVLYEAVTSRAPTALAQAYPTDFSFDAMAKVMRIIGIEDDNAHLRKPEIVQAFCDDAEQVRDGLQDFADYAKEIKGTGNYAGILRLSAEKVLAEFTRTQDHTHLRARRVVKLADELELFSKDQEARADIKAPLAKILDTALADLKSLCRKHFGPSYLALAPLADLTLDHVDQDAVLALFDDIIARLSAGTQDGVVDLDAEGQAILQSMLRELHESRAILASVTSDEFRSILENRFAQNSGAMGLMLNRYAEQSYVALGTIETTGKRAVAAHKTVKGLLDILKAVGITFGGGAAL